MFEDNNNRALLNYSVVFYRLLKESPGFYFTPRTRADLPGGFPEDIEGVPYFMDRYEHPGVPESDRDNVDHISLALNDFKERPGW